MKQKDNKIVETKIKEFRAELGLTQEDLGNMVDVSRQTINAIEKAKYSPSLELAYSISKVFSKTIEEIFIFETSS